MDGISDIEWNLIQKSLDKIETIAEKVDNIHVEMTRLSTVLIGTNGGGLEKRVDRLEAAPMVRKNHKFKMVVLSLSTFFSTTGMVLALIKLFT